MTTLFFRSKVATVLVVVAVVCGIFFAVSKMKRRERDQGGNVVQVLKPDPRSSSGVVEQVAMLKRTEENARARGESAVQQRQSQRESGSGYDEVGNVYRRRATPESIKDKIAASAAAAGPGAASENAPVLVPALRIHGRKNSADPTVAPSNRGPLEALAPALVGPGAGASAGALLSRVGAGLSGSVAPSSTPAARRPERFVPFGRLIKAELVMTLESTQDDMPLVGIVVEPVYNNGKLVIPAGTELHSMARPDRVRDRIVSTTTWRLIFPREGNRPNGRQLTFDGIALDREDGDSNGLTWGIDDGSYGLRGRTVRNGQSEQELLLFAAEALRAISETATERRSTIIGSQVESNVRNAGLTGSQAVMEHFAERISKEIERNGVYIQVPAGKQFYVYPRQVIDPDRADVPQNIANVE